MQHLWVTNGLVSLPTERYKRNIIYGTLDSGVSIGGMASSFIGNFFLTTIFNGRWCLNAEHFFRYIFIELSSFDNTIIFEVDDKFTEYDMLFNASSKDFQPNKRAFLLSHERVNRLLNNRFVFSLFEFKYSHAHTQVKEKERNTWHKHKTLFWSSDFQQIHSTIQFQTALKFDNWKWIHHFLRMLFSGTGMKTYPFTHTYIHPNDIV